jgi:hypothetical protein
MKLLSCNRVGLLGLITLAFLAAPRLAHAQTDEIQVYDAEVAEPGTINVMVHSNFTAIGRKTADFPGGIIPDHSVNGAVEWAFGIKPWFEQGLYFPVYTAYSKGRGGSLNGFKIRELFARPHAADHTFFYGVNFEFSVNYRYWEQQHITSEVRPIVGLHLGKIDLIYNPILDTDYKGGFGNLEFVPAGRVAYNVKEKWADPVSDQFHEVWAVLNHDGKAVSIETGVGVGVTPGADKLTFKLMISRDINRKPN